MYIVYNVTLKFNLKIYIFLYNLQFLLYFLIPNLHYIQQFVIINIKNSYVIKLNIISLYYLKYII